MRTLTAATVVTVLLLLGVQASMVFPASARCVLLALPVLTSKLARALPVPVAKREDLLP